MNFFGKIIITVLLFGFICGIAFSQENDDKKDKPGKLKAGKGFHIGIMVGSFFANNADASIYDGWGFDGSGNKINNFTDSYMNQKINYQYGGYDPTYTTIDQIAPALSTNGQSYNHDDWNFGQADMPLEMRFSPAIMIGLNCRYFVDKKNTLLLNVNATKLTANGSFTLTIYNHYPETVKTFGIKGSEQRLMFQLGYQRIFGNNEKINFFAEAGLNLTMSKFDKNQIMINNLLIDLFTMYNANGNQTIPLQKPVKLSLGGFAGLGISLTMSPKWTIQLLYAPVYERMKLGYDTGLQLQHSIQLRAYYNL